MPNLTITAEEEVLRWARVKAAQENTSVARLVGGLLKERMRAEGGYEAAQRHYLRVKPRVLSRGRYPSRESLHDRARLR
jgi:hypothetical protein